MNDDEGQAVFSSGVDVSRETMAQLEQFVALVKKWTQAINLISRASVDQIWVRHVFDSAQLFKLSGLERGHWVDLGTGGGFPGVVVAIMAREKAPDIHFSFVESDIRKSAFLKTVIKGIGLNADVVSDRAENIDPLYADIVSARALAPLNVLLGFAEPHLKPNGRTLFLKGETFRQEIKDVLEYWSFQSDEHISLTNSSSVVLSLGDIKRV